MNAEMPSLGPLYDALCAQGEAGPPALIREWMPHLTKPSHGILLWAGATQQLSWISANVHFGEGEPQNSWVGTTPASKVERLLSPLAHESRIRMMQALYEGPLTSGELSAATGFQGGGLYHHLRELQHADYVCVEGGRYALTQFGRQMLITVSAIASQAIVDRDEEGLAVGAAWNTTGRHEG